MEWRWDGSLGLPEQVRAGRASDVRFAFHFIFASVVRSEQLFRAFAFRVDAVGAELTRVIFWKIGQVRWMLAREDATRNS